MCSLFGVFTEAFFKRPEDYKSDMGVKYSRCFFLTFAFLKNAHMVYTEQIKELAERTEALRRFL